MTVSHKLHLIVRFSNSCYSPKILNIPLNNDAKVLYVLPLDIVWLNCTPTYEYIPHILESNPHLNLIRTSFCRFLKRKKLIRGSHPHLSFNRPLPTRQTDSVMSDDGESDE